MPTPLARRLTLPVLLLYGLGTILGAGIYVVVGEVAGEAGVLAPLAFLAAGVVALVTGLSFSELSARYPVSAGEAAYVRAGFGSEKLAAAVGLLVTLSGVVSAAAISRGFAGYLQPFLDAPTWVGVTVLVLACTGLAAVGVAESVGVAALMTVVEVGGLLLVLWVAWPALGDLPVQLDQHASRVGPAELVVGAFLSFYAFIGFEDMVNSAEEAVDPQRTMPRAILGAISLATVLYVAVAAVCVAALPPGELAGAKAPLADVYAQFGGDPRVLGAIGLVAVSNGALVQIIMGSRVLYGLSNQGSLPAWLGRVNPRTKTPIPATLLVAAVVLVLALAVPLSGLAQVTSSVLLVVFGLVNVALVRIQWFEGPALGFRVPTVVPLFGALLAAALLVARVVLLVLG